MGKVKVSISNNQTQVKIPVGIRLLVRRCCHAVTEYEGFNDDFEVSVSFVDDETIHQLNLEHRNIDRSTDVLSFPLGENGKYDIRLIKEDEFKFKCVEPSETEVYDKNTTITKKKDKKEKKEKKKKGKKIRG